ncbi:hypothetical protein [Acinetobacter oleivorans]|uniref:hypothetical protein n=1 Tax=Acinetobacter oleivorans TaxID=1148157 RepID=UPI00123177F8|nr:hypothetical protein [Acinetobacter oleivorans]
MQIQIGIDIVLILAFSAYLYFITGWNGKNKAASIKQFRQIPINGIQFEEDAVDPTMLPFSFF